jgi:hypothetical protein
MPSKPTSSKEQEAMKVYLQSLLDDPVKQIEDLISIRAKTGGAPIPFKLYDSQKRFVRNLRRINNAIKIRQMGFTVVNMARPLAKARLSLYFPEIQNRQATIFAKSDEDAPILFNNIKFMDAHLGRAFSGPKKHDASKTIHYADTGWIIRVMTAGKTQAAATAKGRSATDYHAHITEAGYINNLYALQAGILGSIPEGGDLTKESTSSGPRGFFSQESLGIIQNGREIDKGVWALEDRTFMFFGFLEHPEYELPEPDQFDTQDEEEERLMNLGATAGKVLWRRRKIADYGREAGRMSPEVQFKLDYPATWEDAFEEAGGAYFDQKKIQVVMNVAKMHFPAPLEMGLRKAEGGETIAIPASHSNSFKVWRLPAQGWTGRYVFFGDCGQGMPDSDPDAGYIGDLVTKEVVASFHGRFGPELFSDLSMLLCAYYGNATLAFDVTGIGAEVRPYLLRAGYPNLWKRYKTEGNEFDQNAYGMLWTKTSKSEGCSLLRQNIQDRHWLIPDEMKDGKSVGFYDEQRFFAYPDADAVNPEAKTGFHDDRVSALAGLMYVSERMPAPKQERPSGQFDDAKAISLKAHMAKLRRGKSLNSALERQYGG